MEIIECQRKLTGHSLHLLLVGAVGGGTRRRRVAQGTLQPHLVLLLLLQLQLHLLHLRTEVGGGARLESAAPGGGGRRVVRRERRTPRAPTPAVHPSLHLLLRVRARRHPRSTLLLLLLLLRVRALCRN